MPKKINIIIRLQHWIDSVPGQTFLNYAYSWGAAIVILAALFKLTHIKGGNLMLFIGMGTEVVVFFLSAFDRPFDKDEIGKELPRDYETDEEIAASLEDEEEDMGILENADYNTVEEVTSNAPQVVVQTQPAGSPIVINRAPAAAEATIAAATDTPTGGATITDTLGVPQDANAQQLAGIIRMANDELLHRAQAVLSPEMEEATKTYIEKINTLNETLNLVDEQNKKLTQDSEEMENLNRTLTGINKVYELHLKGISLQVGTIDEINAQTKKLAEQIQRLNVVYARMIDALTVNVVRQGGSVTENPTPTEP